jgi:hypothetical protein
MVAYFTIKGNYGGEMGVLLQMSALAAAGARPFDVGVLRVLEFGWALAR